MVTLDLFFGWKLGHEIHPQTLPCTAGFQPFSDSASLSFINWKRARKKCKIFLFLSALSFLKVSDPYLKYLPRYSCLKFATFRYMCSLLVSPVWAHEMSLYQALSYLSLFIFTDRNCLAEFNETWSNNWVEDVVTACSSIIQIRSFCNPWWKIEM